MQVVGQTINTHLSFREQDRESFTRSNLRGDFFFVHWVNQQHMVRHRVYGS